MAILNKRAPLQKLPQHKFLLKHTMWRTVFFGNLSFEKKIKIIFFLPNRFEEYANIWFYNIAKFKVFYTVFI